MTLAPRRRFAAVVLVLSSIFAAASSFAADLTVTDTPETVLRESYRRMQANDWAGTAETFDPAALKQLREMLMPILDATGDNSVSDGLLVLFFGADATPESLKTKSDQEFFAGIVGSMMQASGGRLEGQDVLGGVAEGPDLMHMVVRSKAAAMGLSITKMEVVTMNKTTAGWRLALNGKMEGLVQALQQARSRAAPAESEN